MTRFFRTFALAAGLSLLSSLAFAGPATDYVKSRQTTLQELLRKNDSKKVAETFDQMLDYDSMAQESLGSEWGNRSDAEKAEFSELLKKLVRKSYEKNLRKTLNFTVEFVSEDASSGKVVVKTKNTNKDKPSDEPMRIDYRVADKGGGSWKIDDIITEDVSLVGSYRSQFVKIVKKDGFPALIKKMKDRLARGD